MLRTERITKESAILHELETYNELVPGDDELSVTAFIEYPDRDERERMLVALAGIEECFYVASGSERSAFRGVLRGDDAERTTAVHYLKAKLSPPLREAVVAGTEPVVVGVDHASYRAETQLSGAQVRSLADDLSERV
jgi:hypothetical protein